MPAYRLSSVCAVLLTAAVLVVLPQPAAAQSAADQCIAVARAPSEESLFALL